MNFWNIFKLILLLIATIILTTGCGIQTKQHRSSSVVQYLYPDRQNHVEVPGIPRLALPLRVGIAFVPENSVKSQALTETDKMDLMKEVSHHFKKYDFVKSIELIPSAYLRNDGGFGNLDQIRTMYGIDVITLLSYDQTQFTDEGLASITYWTIIGAYIIPGEKNDTHTMVDATVYDILSRKMLFRAPGTNHIKSNATPVNLTEKLRKDSLESFKVASSDLIKNLDTQLQLFKEKIKEAPEDYQITHRPGYTGGGSLDASFIILLTLLGGYGLWTKKKRKH
ncbi:rhombotarget lipoprotein [uncultured Desulfobacter sp.]|uniref:rhombotarget lipoprotein n=1 Tax=uncultured Desulfobacter sp. TaxID=240139 RepID=UPI0029C7A650|nr:rhombotarget lipoprotein [uncultured Desulfobacter sp.]